MDYPIFSGLSWASCTDFDFLNTALLSNFQILMSVLRKLLSFLPIQCVDNTLFSYLGSERTVLTTPERKKNSPASERFCQICDRISKIEKCWSLFKDWKINDMEKQYMTMRQM